MSWLSKAFKGIGKGLSNIAPILTKIPGPVGTTAKIYTIGSSLFGKKHSNPAKKTSAYLQNAANSQMGYQQQALDAYKRNTDMARAMNISDNQSIYDLARNQYINEQNNNTPYIQATQGMLSQSVPAIQSLLGLQPTQLDMGYNQYIPPERNFIQDYQNTADELAGNNNSIPSNINATSNQTSGSQTIRAVTNPNYKYDIKASPMYEWEKQQMEDKLNGQLAASGLSNSTYAQRELARNEEGLAAQERDRTLNNLYQMANFGMKGQSFNNQRFSPNLSGAGSQTALNQANGIASIYGNMGAIQGQLGAQMAQNQMAGYNAQMKSNNNSNGIGTALDLAHQFGWLGGNSNNGGALPELGLSNATDTIGGAWDDLNSLYDFGF